MKNKVIIQCTDSFQIADVSVQDMQGKTQVFENISLTTLRNQVNLPNSEIFVYLASPEIMIKDLTVPTGMNRTALAKIIPNMVEDDILSNIDNTHFVYKKRIKDQYAVGWVDKARLEEWMRALQSQSIMPKAIYPMIMGMSGDFTHWQVWLKDGVATIKTAAGSGLSVDESMLIPMLMLMLSKQKETPKQITLISAENSAALEAEIMQHPKLHAICQFQFSKTYPIADTNNTKLNLLGNGQEDKNSYQHRWAKHAFIVGGILVAFLLAQQIIYIAKYQHINNEQAAEIKALYQEIYPNATRVTSPRMRMEQDLKKIGGASPFFDLLYHTGSILKQNPDLVVKNFNYRQSRLKLTLEAENYAQIENLIQQLKAQRFSVEQNKVEQSNHKFNAQLTIVKEH